MAITARKDGRYIDVNDAFAKIMGLKQEELLSNTSVSAGFITVEQRALFLDEYRRKGFVENLELQMRVKDGEVRYGLFNSSEITITGEAHYLTIVTDITERKRTEEALLLSNEVMSRMAEGVMMVSMRDNSIVYANPRLEIMFGYDRGELKGKNISIFNPGNGMTDDGIASEIVEAINRDGEWNGEIHSRRKDNSLLWTFASIIAFKHSTYGDVRVGVHVDITERKRAEKAKRDSEQRLQHLTDNLPNAVVYQLTAIPEGGRRFTYVNRRVEQLCEVTQEEVLASADVLYKQMLPEHREVIRRCQEESLKNLSTARCEYLCRLPSGRLRWFEAVSTPHADPDGSLFWDGVALDITERKNAEEAKRESEQRLQYLTDNLPNAVVYQMIALPEGSRRFTYINRRVEQLCEVTQEEALADADALFKQVLPEYQELMRRLHDESERTLATQRFEIQHRLPSGRLRWLEVVSTPRRGQDGSLVWDGVAVDITDRKRSEESAIMQERDFSNTIIDALPGLFYVIDETLGFLLWNKNFTNITGYSDDELRRMTILEFYTESQRSVMVQEIQKIFSLGEHTAEADIILKDGSIKRFLFSARRMNYNDKPCIVGTGFDISTHKRALEELSRFATDLEESNTALRVFMKNQGRDQQIMEQKLQTNINDLVVPYLKKLKQTNLDDRHKKYLSILESNLGDVLSPFMTDVLASHKSLTPQEIQIVDLIRKGKNTKEIAELLNASVNTIATHRNNIRKKMNLRNSKINLRSHALSLK